MQSVVGVAMVSEAILEKLEPMTCAKQWVPGPYSSLEGSAHCARIRAWVRGYVGTS